MYARTLYAAVALTTICFGCELCSTAAPARAGEKDADSKQDVKIAVGEAAPEMCLLNADGSHVDRQDAKGKNLLVAFWSLDDPKRDDLIKQLKQIRQDYLRDDRLRMFSICVDEDWERYMAFLNQQEKLAGKDKNLIDFWSDAKWWQLFHNPSGCGEQLAKANRFNGEKTPDLFLIGPDGRFLAVDIPTDKLAGVLAEKLKFKAAAAP